MGAMAGLSMLSFGLTVWPVSAKAPSGTKAPSPATKPAQATVGKDSVPAAEQPAGTKADPSFTTEVMTDVVICHD